MRNLIHIQSPPAWTQDSHRPPRSKYTLCCSGGEGVPPVRGGYPLPRWIPPHQLDGYPPPVQTWEGVPPPPRQLDGVPPSPSRPGKGLQSENITSRRTTYAGGKSTRFKCISITLFLFTFYSHSWHGSEHGGCYSLSMSMVPFNTDSQNSEQRH